MAQPTPSPEETTHCPALPQEIWWLVTQELTNRLDFSSLFLCARVSRGLASLALPLLYSIHESSPASNAHILDIETSVCLWRSIISSTLGKTLFPYCHWVKTLRLGNLYNLLEDLGRESAADLRSHFFSAPLQKFRIRRGRGKALDLDAIVIDVFNRFTECIKTAADQQDKAVGLLNLEGPHLPSANLPGWVTQLSRLTSLTVRDGSVLDSEVAKAIRENCPGFKEVRCFTCMGMGADADAKLAGFFNNLEPNTLETFDVNSRNNLGQESFKALSRHGNSLKRLELGSLTQDAFSSLNYLSTCLGLEHLALEASTEAVNLRWDSTSLKAVHSEVVQWLQRCVRLRDLSFNRIPQGTEILSQVLRGTTEIQLFSLSIRSVDFSPELYPSLHLQSNLLHLAVRIADEDLLDAGDDRREQLVKAVAHFPCLRELETNELLTIDQFSAIITSLPLLEEIELNSDLIDDCFLLPLSSLPHLKAFTVFGPSNFTFDGIVEFLDNLEAGPEARHDGFQLYVGNQNFEYKFSPDEEKLLGDEIRARFGGKLDIAYRADPDELHESDFSD